MFRRHHSLRIVMCQLKDKACVCKGLICSRPWEVKKSWRRKIFDIWVWFPDLSFFLWFFQAPSQLVVSVKHAFYSVLAHIWLDSVLAQKKLSPHTHIIAILFLTLLRTIICHQWKMSWMKFKLLQQKKRKKKPPLLFSHIWLLVIVEDWKLDCCECSIMWTVEVFSLAVNPFYDCPFSLF